MGQNQEEKLPPEIEIRELNKLALQKKLSIPGSNYTKDRQKWVNHDPGKILDRIKELRGKYSK